MTADTMSLWKRYTTHLFRDAELGMSLDISRMHFDDGFFARMEPRMQTAFAEMRDLEAGAIANPDEDRMVGHYWLRDSGLAPKAELRAEIDDTLSAIEAFTSDIHGGRIVPPSGKRFSHVLSIGIGGSALGPMFVSDALGHAKTDHMSIGFIDNTDPDGIARTIEQLGEELETTLCLVVSKSGGTPETRNGMLLVREAYRQAGLKFGPHAVAVTGVGSQLDKIAEQENWLKRFPMWDWVGGRTSETSAVGLLPAALQGLNIRELLAGAAACDAVTRVPETQKNPAALTALMWYAATDGKGAKDLVVLPYKDRLLLFSRYLQQLIMESLGKRLDRNDRRVDQGLSVYGNKGSTDQHAYVQQLRDGVHNFFVTFIRVLEEGGAPYDVEPGVTAGDYLHGFLQGTRSALYENDRESMTLTVQRIDARTIGMLIALFERAVGYYASLIGINAYHQPGVEAGKKAAAAVLDLQHQVVEVLSATPATAAEIAASAKCSDDVEIVHALLEHLAANGRATITLGETPAEDRFAVRS